MKRIFLVIAALSAAFATQAQQTNSYHYRVASLYETLGVRPGSIVFLGDNFIDWCNWGELLDSKKAVNRGIRSDKTTDVLARLGGITEGKPNKIFLMVGLNDIAGGAAAHTVANNISLIVDRVRKESPSTKIYIHGILPVNEHTEGLPKGYRGKKEVIREVNALLTSMCSMRGLTYIDLYHVMEDGDGNLKPEYTMGGSNLNGQGYLVWKETIKKHVK